MSSSSPIHLSSCKQNILPLLWAAVTHEALKPPGDVTVSVPAQPHPNAPGTPVCFVFPHTEQVLSFNTPGLFIFLIILSVKNKLRRNGDSEKLSGIEVIVTQL